MDNLTLEEKRQQFHEFFTIKHPIKVNMQVLSIGFSLPDVDHLTEHMPYAFRIASEISSIDAVALRPLRSLGDSASDLASFLNHQSRKIDLIMSYVLQQQDDVEHQFEGIEFGGGGVTIVSNSPMELQQNVELKLFINEDASAVFCYGEVIDCQQQEDKYHVSLIYTRIREQDQEVLVRASLHLQTQQLKKRTQNKELT